MHGSRVSARSTTLLKKQRTPGSHYLHCWAQHLLHGFIEPWRTSWQFKFKVREYQLSKEAESLSTAYQAARNRQTGLFNGQGEGHDDRIPLPLLTPSTRAILVCKVLVPQADADGPEARAIPGGPYKIEMVRGAECRPHLLVHINVRGP
jgi:hypothetical protein